MLFLYQEGVYFASRPAKKKIRTLSWKPETAPTFGTVASIIDFALISFGAGAGTSLALACSSCTFFRSENRFLSFGFTTGLIGAAVSYGFAMSGFGGGVAFATIAERTDAAFVRGPLLEIADRALVGGEAGGEPVTTFRKGEETTGAVRGRAPMYVAFLTYSCFGAEPTVKVGPFDNGPAGVIGVTGSVSALVSSVIFRRFEVSG